MSIHRGKHIRSIMHVLDAKGDFSATDVEPHCLTQAADLTSAPLCSIQLWADEPTATKPCVDDVPVADQLDLVPPCDADLEPRCLPSAAGFTSAPLCEQSQLRPDSENEDGNGREIEIEELRSEWASSKPQELIFDISRGRRLHARDSLWFH